MYMYLKVSFEKRVSENLIILDVTIYLIKWRFKKYIYKFDIAYYLIMDSRCLTDAG